METRFAVITGASSGLGLELAKQFGQEGYELLICSMSDDVFEAQRELEEMGISVEAMKVNLASYAGVENLFKRIQNYGKVLDLIVIGAAPALFGDFTKTSLNEEINLMNLNIISAVHLTKRVLPEMKLRQHGKILFASSIASQYEAVYAASRAFLTSFADHLRLEAKDYAVTVEMMKPEEPDNFFSRLQGKLKSTFQREGRHSPPSSVDQ